MKILGIINLTPDSFSDGGKFHQTDLALAEAISMIKHGAIAVDIGAESTRPDAITLTPYDEWNRLEVFIKNSGDIPISLDTRNYQTAQRALKYKNILYVNDVSGFADKNMVALAADAKCKIIAMHSLTVPANREVVIRGDEIAIIKTWIAEKLEQLTKSGIAANNIIFDIGLGFGKTAEQSWNLIAKAAEFKEICKKLGVELLYGHSRKSFLAKISDKKAQDRDFETALVTSYLQNAEIDYIRAHNVEINQLAITIGDDLLNRKNYKN